MKGYISFKEEQNFQEGNILKSNEENNYIVYSTIPDSLRFAIPEEKRKIAEVETIGEVYPFNSEYYGYYNMLTADSIKVLRILSEKDIMSAASHFDRGQLMRFISSYKIPEEYLESFSYCDIDIWKCIQCYQMDNKKIYEEPTKELVKKYERYQKNHNKGCEGK